MRSFAKRIVDLVKDEVSEDEMKKVKQEMLSEVGQCKHFFQDSVWKNHKKELVCFLFCRFME